jgi:hypothetical protein
VGKGMKINEYKREKEAGSERLKTKNPDDTVRVYLVKKVTVYFA